MHDGFYGAYAILNSDFIQHSKNILNDLEALKRNTVLIHDGIEQELVIAANNIIPASVLVDFICDFERQFPSTTLRITLEVYNGCWDALYSKRAGLVIGAPHAVPSTKGVISEPIGQLEWDFVVGPQQAWLLEGQKPLFVPDFPTAIALIQKNVGIGYIPHHLAQPLLNNGQLVKKPMQEHKHATKLFLAARSDGMGKGVWIIYCILRLRGD